MRACLPLMVALALAGHAAPSLAQAATDKSAPPQKQGATDATGDRVDALSPDEARRAARARAEAKKPPVVSESAKPAQKPIRAAAKPQPTPDTRAASKAETRPPKQAATATEPRPSEATRAAAAPTLPPRPVHHAARPLRNNPPQETAEDAWRHARRPYQSAARRPPAGFAEPKVGDVVPPGVPLYPLPPGYGPHAAAARAGLPPFPRSRDDEAEDDDGPPPRHGFMAPY